MKKKLLNIALHTMHSSGRAVGYCGTSKVYADNAIPGEVVDLEIDRVQRGYRYGKVTAVVLPSAARVVPFCRHNGLCGGCPWQHIAYNEQLHWKLIILQNALHKYGIETPPLPAVIPSPLLQGYRNKSEYTFAACDYENQHNVLGFHVGERRDTVCAIEECFLQSPEVQKIALAVKKKAVEWGFSFYDYPTRKGLLKSLQLRTTTAGQLLLCIDIAVEDARIVDFLQQINEENALVTAGFYSIERGEPKAVFGEHYLTEQSSGLIFRYGPTAFYQPNPLQAQNLCAQVCAFADLSGHELVYDLYTGVGTLACHVARHAAAVIGIEGNAQAIEEAKQNAAINGMANARFLTGDILHTFNDEFIGTHGRPDVIILDPPRSGTLIEIKKTMLRAAPRKIIYVSCNPVSLAFDLKQLCEKYRVTGIQPFDMFPHTHHVETVALLELR